MAALQEEDGTWWERPPTEEETAAVPWWLGFKLAWQKGANDEVLQVDGVDIDEQALARLYTSLVAPP